MAEQVDPSLKRIFLGNLPEEINREYIKELCGSIGRIVNIELVQSKRKEGGNEGGQAKRGPAGRPQTFSFITFLTHEDAQDAINKLAGRQYWNRTLTASWAKADNRQKTDNSGMDSWKVKEEQRKKANQEKKQKKNARPPMPLSTLIPKPQVPTFPIPQKAPVQQAPPKQPPKSNYANKSRKPARNDEAENGQDQDQYQFDNEAPEQAPEHTNQGFEDDVVEEEEEKLPEKQLPPPPSKSAKKGNKAKKQPAKNTGKGGESAKPVLYQITVKKVNVKGPAELMFNLTEEEVDRHIRPLAQEASKNKNHN